MKLLMSCTVEGHSQRSLPVRSRTIGLSERASGNTEKRHLGGEGQNFAHVFPKTWQVNWGKYSYVDDIDMRSDQSFLSSYFCVQASLWSSHVWTRKPLKNSWSWKIWICPRQVMSKLYAFLPQFIKVNHLRNCLQYEPDHPIYLRTLSLVHSHVSESGNFDTLLATRFMRNKSSVVWQNDSRHYGPMVFNLCWNKQQDELLVHLVMNDRYSKEKQSRQRETLNNRMEEAVDVVAVYLRLHPECSLAVSSGLKMLSGENLLRRFCQLEALKTGKISMAVAKMVEEKAQRLRLKQSHGAKWLTYRNCLCASVPWIRCITFSINRENGNMADVLSIQCILKNP